MDGSKKSLVIVLGLMGVAVMSLWVLAFVTKPTLPAPMAHAPTPSPSPTPAMQPAEILSLAKRKMAAGLKIDLEQALRLLNEIPEGAKEHKEARTVKHRAEKRLAEMLAEETLLGSKPRTIGDTVWCVDRYLKRNLNDYDDSEYLEWSPITKVTLKGQPFWSVRLRLRARNAFGAKIVKDVVFYIRNEQVLSTTGL